MYRAEGDANNALKYARQVPPPAPGTPGEAEQLVHEILLDRHDWAPLIADANRHANDASNPMLRRAALAEKLSYARLAGDAKLVGEALASIHEAVEQNAEFAPAYAAALLLNDRSAEGIDLLSKAKGFSGLSRPWWRLTT